MRLICLCSTEVSIIRFICTPPPPTHSLDSIISTPSLLFAPPRWIRFQLKAGHALCFYLSWQGSLTSEAPFHCDLIRSVKEGGGQGWRTEWRGGNQVKVGSQVVYLHLLIGRISPSLGKLDLCGPSSSPSWKRVFCVQSEAFEVWRVPPHAPSQPPQRQYLHFSLSYLLPDIPHYLRLCWKKECRVIKLTVQVFCHQRMCWPSRGH